MTKRYEVELKNTGNPDMRQDGARPLPGTKTGRVPVTSLAAASKACREYIARNELGAGNWSGGALFHENKQVGQVSYNGVVWPPGGYAIGTKPLYDPRPLAAEPQEDPFAWEEAEIDVAPYGRIVVGGCLRVGNCKSIVGGFHVDGVRQEFMANISFEADGLISYLDFNLLPKGSFDKSRPAPRVVKEAVHDAVTVWMRDPANFAMILRNEAKDRRKNVAWIDGRIASLYEQIRQHELERSAAIGAAEATEERAAQLGSGTAPGPGPR